MPYPPVEACLDAIRRRISDAKSEQINPMGRTGSRIYANRIRNHLHEAELEVAQLEIEIAKMATVTDDLMILLRYYTPADIFPELMVHTHEKAEACRGMMDRPVGTMVPVAKEGTAI